MLAAQIPTTKVTALIGGAIVFLIVLGLLVKALRRRLLADQEAGSGLDMETLQRQHREGVISDEEFKTLRRAILGLPAEGPAEGQGQSEPSEPADS